MHREGKGATCKNAQGASFLSFIYIKKKTIKACAIPLTFYIRLIVYASLEMN